VTGAPKANRVFMTAVRMVARMVALATIPRAQRTAEPKAPPDNTMAAPTAARTPVPDDEGLASPQGIPAAGGAYADPDPEGSLESENDQPTVIIDDSDADSPDHNPDVVI
jgi:hypothetical protein